MGKIDRFQRSIQLKTKISDKMDQILSKNIDLAKIKDSEENIFLFLIVWDDVVGPRLKKSYPEKKLQSNTLDSIGEQLFFTSTALFGQAGFYDAQGVLLRMKNFELDAYIYFDTVHDNSVRGGVLQYMLGTIAYQIDYLTSLRIKEILEEISLKIKAKQQWDIAEYWKRVHALLSNKFLEASTEV
jgi:hypothetical protein